MISVTQNFERSLIEALSETMEIRIVGANSTRLAGTTMAIFPDIPIDFFLIGLDEVDIIVSTGLSCKSNSRIPSPALLALGLSSSESLQVVRFSYDQHFSLEKQNYVIKMAQEIIQKLI